MAQHNNDGCNLPAVFVVGYPGDIGGANTECWHVIKLWRRFGLEVTCIPTGQPEEAWRERLGSIGCRTIECEPADYAAIPGLRGGVVVSFCNSNFLRYAEHFRDLDCQIVWLNCMTWLFAEERKHYRQRGPFDRYVFQSEYQQDCLQPQLARFGVEAHQCYHIRGAFFHDEFVYRPLPHESKTPFVIGRISRAAEDKYSSNTWPIYQRVPYPIRARLMAWNEPLQAKLGPPPNWAECLAAGAETPQQFFASLHCMVQVNGGAGENWPRSGLEAMACGVPLVVQNQWGWREMVQHGQTGYLCDNDEELAYYTARLAYDEPHRLEMAHRARQVLESDLANHEAIWSRWHQLFSELESARS